MKQGHHEETRPHLRGLSRLEKNSCHNLLVDPGLVPFLSSLKDVPSSFLFTFPRETCHILSFACPFLAGAQKISVGNVGLNPGVPLKETKKERFLGCFSSALLPAFFGEGSPTKIDLRKTVGTNLF